MIRCRSARRARDRTPQPADQARRTGGPEFRPVTARGERQTASGSVDAIVGFAKISGFLRDEERGRRRPTTARRQAATATRWKSPPSAACATKTPACWRSPVDGWRPMRRRAARGTSRCIADGVRLVAPMTVVKPGDAGHAGRDPRGGTTPVELGIVRRMKRLTADRAKSACRSSQTTS